MTRTIREPARAIDVIYETDVLNQEPSQSP